MSILSGLDKSYDNVLSTLIERILSESVIDDDAKAFLLSYESKLNKYIIIQVSPLPSINFTVKNSRDHKVFDINTNPSSNY